MKSVCNIFKVCVRTKPWLLVYKEAKVEDEEDVGPKGHGSILAWAPNIDTMAENCNRSRLVDRR